MSPADIRDEDFLAGRDVDNIAPLKFNDVRTVDEILEKEPESPRSDVKDDSSFEDEKKLHANALAFEGSEFDEGFRHGDETLVASGDDNDPDYKDIPLIVRELVDFEDDPSVPVLTWRFYLLATIFVALGAFVRQLSFFRTTSVPYSIYFVMVASLYFGRFLARTLPEKEVGFGRFKFQLNPGPFSTKEHVAIVLAASTGASSNLGDYVLAPLIVFYDAPMNGWLAILFMWSCVFIGFAYASFAKRFLIDDPKFLFPLTLQKVSVFKALRGSMENDQSRTYINQQRCFWYGILIIFCWQWFPEYIFPFTTSLSLLCWVSSNPNVVFAGSGLGGAGYGAITLDWSNIGSSFLYQPFWVINNSIAASIICCWILIPICYYTGIWGSDKYPIQSQTLWQANQSVYPTAKLLNHDWSLNEKLFEEVGVPRISAQVMWGYFFSYVAYISSFVTLVLFRGPALWKSLKLQRAGVREHNDKLNKLMEPYEKVPWWWNIILFIIPFVILIALTATGQLYMPIYALFFGLMFGAAIVLPMGAIYAVSGYSVSVGYFNEIVYGYMIDIGGSRHPIGSLSYRVISGQAWYCAQDMLSDMKLGHYFHIPPKAVLFSQIWGILVGVPINYAVIVWVTAAKRQYLTGQLKDPLKQWTGQTIISLNNQSIQFALVGPKRLFADPAYTPMLYGFLVGAAAPILLRLAHGARPKWRFDLWNVTIFASTGESHYIYNSVGFFTWYILACVNHLYIKKHKYEFWKKYAYLAGAAADTGFNLQLLLSFLFFSSGKNIAIPVWWGNNAESVERCFPAK